jgi:uncharacterized protein (DUF934 family)
MKIIAASAVPTALKTPKKPCKSPTTPTWPTGVASGALQGVERIELHFPKFTDGRAFSQAVLLRRRYRFAGDIRATGDVLIDQLVQMAAAALRAPCWQKARTWRGRAPVCALCAFYQGDVLQPRPLFAREAA